MYLSTSNPPAAVHAGAAASAAVSSKLEKDTIYMPSSVAVLVLGAGARDARQADAGTSERHPA